MKFLLLFTMILATACGGNRKAEGPIAAPVEEVDLFVFDFEAGINDTPHAATINDLADSICYIPLETTEKALLPGHLAFAKIGECMYVSGQYDFSRKHYPVFEFDADGRFVKQVTYHGRGPNEILYTWAWFANENLRQINIVDAAYKMVTIDTDSGERLTSPIDPSQGYHRIPLNDSTFVSVQSLGTHRDIPGTYLYFTDRTGNMARTIERTDELSSYNARTTEYNQMPPYEIYGLWADYTGDAIFQDIFNDTLYRVKSRREITPHLVFKRDSLSPRPEDKQNAGAKRKQAYFSRVMESGDYVFLSYIHDDKTWQDVWSKRNGSLMIHAEDSPPLPNFFVPFELPDGSVTDLQIVYADKNNVYCVMNALDACKFMKDLKEDDNPVIVTVKLKNNPK